MAGKILSMEIGTQMTHLVEIDYKVKNPKIYQYFSLPTPENVMADGSVAIVPEFIEAIRAEVKKRNIKTKKVVFVMNSTRIANREVEIPLVKEKQIHNLLVTNSAEFFPVDLTQYQLAHEIVERNETERKYKLSVLAVPNEMIASYAAFAKALDWEMTALDYIGNSITQGMLRLLQTPVKVVIKIDENSSMLTLVKDEKVQLQRNISYGIREAVELVMEEKPAEKRSFSKALEILCRESLIAEKFETKMEQPLKAEVTESIRPLVGNIRRVLDYYTSRHQETVIEEVWMIGIASECQGLEQLMSNELSIPVKVLNNLPEIIANRNMVAEDFRMSEYVVALAATLNPLKFSLEKKENRKKFLPGNELFLPGAVCGICLVLSIVLVGSSLIASAVLNGKNEKMSRQIEQLQEAEDIYQTYELTSEEYSGIQEIYSLTKTPNDAFLTFLGEMEQKLPSETVVEKMTAGADGISMDIKVSDKTVAADVIQKLRDFATLSEVRTGGITEIFDDAGKSQVTFSVVCVYAQEISENSEE